MLEQLRNISTEISKVANHTPVLTSSTLNKAVNAQVFIKCENFQKGGAFKFRGAFNAISKLSEEQKKKGIITHSSGNHAQAVALNGRLQEIPTVIVMPDNAPMVKVNATRGYGAQVLFSESTIEARERICNEQIAKHGYTLIHPYDNRNVIEGAASTAVELLDEVGELDLLIVPVGGGGLISGCSMYAKLSGKVKRVIGAEPRGADDAFRSMQTGVRVTSHTPNTIADGLRTLLSDQTFSIIQDHVDEIVTVNDEEIISSMKFLWERMKIVVEPSSAVVLAVLRKIEDSVAQDAKIGLILSGGNVDLDSYFETLQ